MSKIDDTYQLIKSLNKNEKRFFKIFSKRHFSDKDLKYITLFNIYDSYSSFNVRKFDLDIKNKNLHLNIRYLKHQLNLQILRSLNAYHYSQDNIELKVSNHLQNASILFDKGLFNHAYKKIQQAKSIARKYNLTLLLLECYDKEKAISRELYQIDWLEYHASQGFDEEKKLLNEYKEICKLYKIRNDLVLINKSTIHKTNSLNKIEHLIANLNLENRNSFSTTEMECVIKSFFYIAKNDYVSAIQYQTKLVQLFESDYHQIDINKNYYLSALYNLLVSNLIIKSYEQVEFILQKLDVYREKSAARLINLKLFNYLNIALAYYNLKGDFEKSSAYESIVIQGISKYNQSIHVFAKITLYLHLVVAFIGIKDYTRAHYWINKTNLEHQSEQTLLYFVIAQVLFLVVLFEEKRYKFLHHVAARLKHELLELDNKQSLVVISDFFCDNDFNLLSKNEIKDIMITLKEKLEDVFKDKNEKSILDVFDIINWLNTYVYNQSFKYLIQIKFNSNDVPR